MKSATSPQGVGPRRHAGLRITHPDSRAPGYDSCQDVPALVSTATSDPRKKTHHPRAIQVQSLDEREEIFDDKLDSDGARR